MDGHFGRDKSFRFENFTFSRHRLASPLAALSTPVHWGARVFSETLLDRSVDGSCAVSQFRLLTLDISVRNFASIARWRLHSQGKPAAAGSERAARPLSLQADRRSTSRVSRISSAVKSG